jgi:glutaredoxin
VERVALKLHRCRFTWVPFDTCNRVQSALDDTGIEYELVIYPWSRRKRDAIEKLSGQKYYPVIEFEDGSIYREESKDMAATIRAGKLDEKWAGARSALTPARGAP